LLAATTDAPCRANSSAVALPMPLPPPVMIATLSLSLIESFNVFPDQSAP